MGPLTYLRQTLREALAMGEIVLTEDAFTRHEAAIRAVVKARHVNVDVWHVSRVVQGAMLKVARLRPELEQLGGGLKLAKIDALPTLVKALEFVSTALIASATTTAQHMELRAEAIVVRRRLLHEQQGLLARKQTQLLSITPFREDAGYIDVANDLMLLVRFFSHALDAGEVCTVTRDELREAEEYAVMLLQVSRWKDDRKRDRAAKILLKQQTYALIVEAYGELRAAVQFLRRDHKDADAFTPPLLRVKRKRKRVKKVAPAEAMEPKESSVTAAEQAGVSNGSG